MKAQLLALAAGLLVASAAQAEAPSQAFFTEAREAADARLAKQGVDLAGQSLSIRGHLGNDARLNGVKIARSSGSRELDDAVVKALRNLKVTAPPALVGRDVTVELGGATPTAAAASH
ncbi:MAG TPA: energy transducer TonB [Phenylobacterium sp.]|nr:energy transducer TonB [Phenylobacterium sp.]